MKTTIRIDSLLAIAACGLWLGGNTGVHAQENNAAPRSINPAVAEAAGPAITPEAETITNAPSTTADKPHGLRLQPVVSIGHSVELKAEDSAEAIVVIGGSAHIHGDVRESIVVIGGSVNMDGACGDAIVTIGGNVNVNGKVKRDVVAVLGNVSLGPAANVNGNVVTVGGVLSSDKDAHIGGTVQQIPLPRFEEFQRWFVQCVLMLRPLAPGIRWVWFAWGAFTLIYLLTAALIPRPVQASVNQLNTRPALTFLFGLLANLILPIILTILAATGVGLLVAPFFIAAQVIGMIIGKVAIIEYLGGLIGRYSRTEFLQKPLATFVMGTVIITLLYVVPVIGILTWGVTSLWGFGAAVTAMFARSRREAMKPPASTSPISGDPTTTTLATVPATTTAASGAGEGAAAESLATAPSAAAPSATASSATAPSTSLALSPPANLPVLAHPKAGFWIRMAALSLDMVLMCLAAVVAGPLVLLVALLYFAGMWRWKGTTIGGIVCKLQVVRQDGGPLTPQVALVRALCAAFSAVALFLGFFWIAWDPDRQAWHDKIAGTYVVCLPQSMPLVCL